MEIGQEETPDQYVTRLVGVFREARRVLRDDGTLWVNLGDSYASGGREGHGTRVGYKQQSNRGMSGKADPGRPGQPPGIEGPQLLGVPWKFAEAMRADGWLLRAELVWVKLSAMPESVSGWRWEKCRVKTRAGRHASSSKGLPRADGSMAPNPDHSRNPEVQAQYEDCPGCKKCSPNGGFVLRKGAWRPTRATESIFLFAKSDRYYCDGEAVKQLARASTVMRDRYTRVLDDPDEQFAARHDHETQSGGTANLRNWVVFKGEMLKEKHYAAFPSGIPLLAIRAGTSQKGVCPHCGAPWARVVENGGLLVCGNPGKSSKGRGGNTNNFDEQGFMGQYDRKTVGWRPTCKCPAHDPVPATVLEPFMGSGTTLAACERANRRGIGIDLSGEYLDIAAKRVRKAAARKGFGLA